MVRRRLPSPLVPQLLFHGANLSGVSGLVIYSWLAQRLWVGAPPQATIGYMVVVALGTALVNVPVGMVLTRPLSRLTALADHVPSENLPPGDVLATLRLPRTIAWIQLVEWVLPATLFAVFVPFPLVDRVTAFGVSLMVGLLVAAATYQIGWVMERFWIAPVLLAHGNFDHLGRIRITRVWQYVGLAGLLIAALPLSVVALLVFYRDVPWSLLLFVLLVVPVEALLLIMGSVAMISRPIGHLRDRMKEVMKGDFSVQAEVGGLDTFGLVASIFNKMVAGLRQREFLRETFGRYVTQQIADAILAGDVALGGERRVATVLFADIRDFTRMSEGMPPEEVVAFLNGYLDAMVTCVLDHGGVLDKFIGDAVMAVFGVPVRNDPSADALAAVQCAMAMSDALDGLNARRTAVGLAPIEIGIGIHTGELVAGNIGSQRRMEYTVIGDTVNVTSRIEGMTKQLGRRVLVSSATAALVGDRIPLVALDVVDIRGRTGRIQLHTAAGR